MKKHLNPPQDAQIFSATFGIWQAAKAAIVTGTVFSIVAEFAIVQNLIKEHGTQFFTHLPPFLPATLAAVFVVVLAMERIKYGRQAGKLTTDRESRKLGFAANFIVFAACFFVFGISGALSYIGSKAAVQQAIKPPALQTTTGTDSTTTAKITAIGRQYSTDSSSTAATWAARIASANQVHQAKIAQLKVKIEAGKYWLKNELNEAKSAQKNEIAALKAERAAALLRANERRQNEISEIKSLAATEITQVTNSNTKALQQTEFLQDKAGNLIPLISLGALVTLLIGLFLDERFKFKAGIKEVVLISDYDGLPSLYSEYKEAFTAVFSGIARKIARYIKNLAPQAITVLDASAAELVKIELSKYKEKVLNFSDTPTPPAAPGTGTGAGTHQPAPGIGYKTYKKETTPPDPENDRNNGESSVITELFNSYRINRQILKTYMNKQAKGEGNPDTLSKGVSKHYDLMNRAALALIAKGYMIEMNESARKLELKKIN